jgi:hypothetical protein
VGTEYTFWVRGRISPDILAALYPLLPVVSGPETELRGAFVDQVALHGIIARLEGLGVRLIAFQRAPDERFAVARRAGARPAPGPGRSTEIPSRT